MALGADLRFDGYDRVVDGLTRHDLIWLGAIRESQNLEREADMRSNVHLANLLRVGFYNNKGPKPMSHHNQHMIRYAVTIGSRIYRHHRQLVKSSCGFALILLMGRFLGWPIPWWDSCS